jgi:hypothetical protein
MTARLSMPGALAGAALALPLAAAAAMYRCPLPQSPGEGIVTNLLSEADAKQRECVQLSPRRSTLDAPAAPPPPAMRRGATMAAAPVRAADEPRERRVSPAVQRVRDDDRRLILERELRTEQGALARVRQRVQAVAADDAERRRWEQEAARHQSNVEALQREIARLP